MKLKQYFAGFLAALIALPSIAATPPPGQLVSGYYSAGSLTKQIAVDNLGRVLIVGSGVGGVVYGNDATGVAPTQAPVLSAGWDGTLTRTFLTDTGGRQVVNVNGSVAVTGTFWQATQPVSMAAVPVGGSTAALQSSTQGTVAAGTAATNSTLTGCQFNTTLPTLTNTQQAAFQCGTRGSQNMTLFGSNSVTPVDAVLPADGSTPVIALGTSSYNAVFNGTTWDRMRSAINALNSTGTGVAAVGIAAQLDDTSPTAITENQFGNVRMSSERALYAQTLPSTSATSAIAPAVSAALVSNVVAKASAGNLYRIAVTTSSTAGYLMVFNATTVPVDGAVTPQLCRYVGSTSSLEVDHSSMPDRYTTGISVAFSTTGCFTKTASVTAMFEIQVQ